MWLDAGMQEIDELISVLRAALSGVKFVRNSDVWTWSR